MWVILNDSFLSIVAHRSKPDTLLVRARAEGDIESVFSGAEVTENVSADYRYRAEISRKDVAEALASRALGIEYDNFKNSVLDMDRHDAYLIVWRALMEWGRRRLGPGPVKRWR